MVMVDTSGCRVPHAGVKAAVLNDRGDIIFTTRIRQVIEEKRSSHSKTDGSQSTAQKLGSCKSKAILESIKRVNKKKLQGVPLSNLRTVHGIVWS